MFNLHKSKSIDRQLIIITARANNAQHIRCMPPIAARTTWTLSMPLPRTGKLLHGQRHSWRLCRLDVDFAGLFGCPASSTSSIDAADAAAEAAVPPAASAAAACNLTSLTKRIRRTSNVN